MGFVVVLRGDGGCVVVVVLVRVYHPSPFFLDE